LIVILRAAVTSAARGQMAVGGPTELELHPATNARWSGKVVRLRGTGARDYFGTTTLRPCSP